MNFYFIRLTASLGFEARYLIVSEIAVYPENRNTDNAVLRIQCDLFSIVQCPRRPASKRFADASSGFRLVIP